MLLHVPCTSEALQGIQQAIVGAPHSDCTWKREERRLEIVYVGSCIREASSRLCVPSLLPKMGSRHTAGCYVCGALNGCMKVLERLCILACFMFPSL